MSLSKLWEIVKDREACSAAVHGIGQDEGTKQQQTANQIHTANCKKAISDET